jgi:hypothetical protein
MFEAMILICLTNVPDECTALRDLRGPYETMGQCNVRSAEMARSIKEDPRTANLYTVNGARCDKVTGMKTKTSNLSDLEV